MVIWYIFIFQNKEILHCLSASLSFGDVLCRVNVPYLYCQGWQCLVIGLILPVEVFICNMVSKSQLLMLKVLQCIWILKHLTAAAKDAVAEGGSIPGSRAKLWRRIREFNACIPFSEVTLALITMLPAAPNLPPESPPLPPRHQKLLQLWWVLLLVYIDYLHQEVPHHTWCLFQQQLEG